MLVSELRREPAVERVTPERIAASAGSTQAPFAGSLPCTVYVVPLDTASVERADEVSRRLTELPVQPCSLPPLRLDTQALDPTRGQLDALVLAAQLRDLFVGEWDERKSTVIGVTEHDLFTSGDPSTALRVRLVACRTTRIAAASA